MLPLVSGVGCSSRLQPLASGVGAWGTSSRLPPLALGLMGVGQLLPAVPLTSDAG